MAGNYLYPWNIHLSDDSNQYYQHHLLAGAPVQPHPQVLFRNLQQRLHPILPPNSTHRPGAYSLPRNSPCTVTGSLSSSPLSDCHDFHKSNFTEIMNRYKSMERARTLSPSEESSVTSGSSSSLTPPSSIDQPMDLSKPKRQSSLEPPTQRGFRLKNLLSNNKRKMEDSSSLLSNSQQTGPLNLSKRTCRPSAIPHNFSNRPAVVDMTDAVNNPVELVRLVNQSQMAGKITHHINQMICKVFTLQPFHDLRETDRVSIVLNCWHRLLLWIYAENKFTFQVTTVNDCAQQGLESPNHKKLAQINHPSMAFVKSIAMFLKKYEELEVDREEMTLLFAITLFHSTGDEAHMEPQKIANHRKGLLNQLQTIARRRSDKPGGDKRYVDLLMYLPMLYGVNGKMVEGLFCSHLSSDGDMKLMIKDVIKTYSRQSSHPPHLIESNLPLA